MALTNSAKLALQFLITSTDAAGNQFQLGRQKLEWNLATCPVCHGKVYTVTTGSPVTLTLSDGSLKQPDNSNAVFTKVRGLWILNVTDPATITAILSAGGGTHAAAWLSASHIIGGPTAPLFKGDPLSAGGLAVASGSADVITLSASGADALAMVVIGGE